MPVIPATLCYVRKNGKTLMMHRIKKQNDIHEDKWNGLGGKFESGESPEDCVVREILEESGLKIINPELKGFLTFPLFDGFNDWLVFVFVAHEFEGELINSTEGHLEWIDDDNLPNLNLWEGDMVFLPWLKENGFFSAKFTYTNGRLIDYSTRRYPIND